MAKRKPFVAQGIAANNPNGWLVVVCKGSPKIEGNIRVTVREVLPRCRHKLAEYIGIGYGKVVEWCPDCGGLSRGGPGSRMTKPRRA